MTVEDLAAAHVASDSACHLRCAIRLCLLPQTCNQKCHLITQMRNRIVFAVSDVQSDVQTPFRSSVTYDAHQDKCIQPAQPLVLWKAACKASSHRLVLLCYFEVNVYVAITK